MSVLGVECFSYELVPLFSIRRELLKLLERICLWCVLQLIPTLYTMLVVTQQMPHPKRGVCPFSRTLINMFDNVIHVVHYFSFDSIGNIDI